MSEATLLDSVTFDEWIKFHDGIVLFHKKLCPHCKVMRTVLGKATAERPDIQLPRQIRGRNPGGGDHRIGGFPFRFRSGDGDRQPPTGGLCSKRAETSRRPAQARRTAARQNYGASGEAGQRCRQRRTLPPRVRNRLAAGCRAVEKTAVFHKLVCVMQGGGVEQPAVWPVPGPQKAAFADVPRRSAEGEALRRGGGAFPQRQRAGGTQRQSADPGEQPAAGQIKLGGVTDE